MADNPERPKENHRPAVDVAHAPFLFYDFAPAFGHNSGIINITLGAGRVWISPDGELKNERVVTAYLCGSVQAARGLRDALDKALLLAVPSDGGKAN
jgi:hypothetical protein